MFKVLGIIFLASVLTFNAQAAENNPQSKETRFEELLEKFDEGTRPAKAEIIGDTKGLCYHRDTPNSARTTYLVGRTRQGEAQGPLFPKTEILQFTIFWSNIFNLDVLDTSSSIATADTWVSDFLKQGESIIVRKSNGYLMAVVMANKRTDSFQIGEPIASCYFFGSKRPR